MTSAPVLAQQCLYGYQDGHRLLASSTKLTSHDGARLLIASDLTPGLHQTYVDYLTGMPLQSEQLYALMRTWSAPELPRPGCVWTHVILIPLPDLARFVDLGGLRTAFRKPESTSPDYRQYAKPIEFVPDSMESAELKPDGLVHTTAERIFRAVYSEVSTKYLKRDEATDNALFAVWSQQWPRLRRAFSFRTAVGDIGSPKELRIAMQFVIKGHPVAESMVNKPSWDRIAVDDLFVPQPSDLRRFLWRYASDIRNGRDAFPVLVDVFLRTRDDTARTSSLKDILDGVFRAFPSEHDAQVLKSDLLSFEKTPFSRVPASDPVGIWRFLIASEHGEAWDMSFDDNLDYPVDDLLQNRFDEAVSLAQDAMHSDRRAGKRFLRAFASAIRDPDFWTLVNRDLSLGLLIAQTNLQLLDSRRLVEAPDEFLVRVLTEITAMDSVILGRLVSRLLDSSSPTIIESLQNQMPDVLYAEMAHCLANRLPSPAWIRSFTTDAHFWIHPNFLRQLAQGRALVSFMQQISPETSSITRLGTKPWTELRRSSGKHQRNIYVETFLMVLGLKVEDETFHLLIADAFPVVYDGIMNREIPDQLFSMLARAFPEVPLWRQWDNCYRLTLAVAQALARHNLPVGVVADNLRDRSARTRLIRLYNKDSDADFGPDDDFTL